MSQPVTRLIDNDIVKKLAAYGLLTVVVPASDSSVGVLGAARFVVRSRLARMPLRGNRSARQQALAEFIAAATSMEPTDDEVSLAADIELAAQRAGLDLDAGESQLAAMAVHRLIALLDTGDKRAIRGFERLVALEPGTAYLKGRLRCFEQVILEAVRASDDDGASLAAAICAEPDVDKALSISFECYSRVDAAKPVDEFGLLSYISTLRAEAPCALAAAP